ncbi:hypothetical protein LPJ53_003684, partial [Coemansia erecta]
DNTRLASLLEEAQNKIKQLQLEKSGGSDSTEPSGCSSPTCSATLTAVSGQSTNIRNHSVVVDDALPTPQTAPVSILAVGDIHTSSVAGSTGSTGGLNDGLQRDYRRKLPSPLAIARHSYGRDGQQYQYSPRSPHSLSPYSHTRGRAYERGSMPGSQQVHHARPNPEALRSPNSLGLLGYPEPPDRYSPSLGAGAGPAGSYNPNGSNRHNLLVPHPLPSLSRGHPEISALGHPAPPLARTSYIGPDGDADIDADIDARASISGNSSGPSAEIAQRPPGKRRKRHHDIASKVRSVQPVPQDKAGNYEMPVQVGILTVLNLGHVVWDRDAYHNERYIWPVGYTVQREYYSMRDPNRQVIYTCWITDGGEAPLFHVEAEDMSESPIVAPTATGAWTTVLRAVNKIRQREHSNSASGPDYFGFSHPTIAKMIQDLPGTDRCRTYITQHFVSMKDRHVRGVIKKGRGGRPSVEMLSRGQRALMASTSTSKSAWSHADVGGYDHGGAVPSPASYSSERISVATLTGGVASRNGSSGNRRSLGQQ